MHASLTRRLEYVRDNLLWVSHDHDVILNAQHVLKLRLIEYAVTWALTKSGLNARIAIIDAEELAHQLTKDFEYSSWPGSLYRYLHDAYNESCQHPE